MGGSAGGDAHRRSRARKQLAAFGAAASLAIACAHPEPPSGGPVDDSPPRVASTSPRLFETNVTVDRPLRIVFDEGMNRSLAEDGIVVRPSVDWGRQSWRGDTLIMEPRDFWRPATTYTVLIRRGIADQRGNQLTEPAFVVFSTGGAVEQGRVSGQVVRIGVSEGDVLVLAFPDPVPDTTAVDLRAAVSVAEPDQAGRFLLPGLRVGRPYEIGAFFDVNENRGFDPERDLYCRALAPVVPDSAGGPADVAVVLVFADEPGRITGVVVDTTCVALSTLADSLGARAQRMTAERDSLLALRGDLMARADSLIGAAVAPPDTLSPAPAESLRGAGEDLRRQAGALVIADSASIAAASIFGPQARADSVYCATPIIARFRAPGDTTAYEDQPYGTPASIDISGVPPGAYQGVIWRDLDGDARYDPATEPGTRDTLSVWVAPGQSGILDTLRIARSTGATPDREEE